MRPVEGPCPGKVWARKRGIQAGCRLWSQERPGPYSSPGGRSTGPSIEGVRRPCRRSAGFLARSEMENSRLATPAQRAVCASSRTWAFRGSPAGAGSVRPGSRPERIALMVLRGYAYLNLKQVWRMHAVSSRRVAGTRQSGRPERPRRNRTQSATNGLIDFQSSWYRGPREGH